MSPGSLLTQSLYSANYNSLQTGLTKRMRGGLQFQLSYTWAKVLDETSGSGGSPLFELLLATNDQHNPRQAYGLTDSDRSQRLVLNFIWSVPPVHGGPAVAHYLLKDWQFSGIGVAQSGNPLTITDDNAGSVYGNLGGQARAQRTGSNPSTAGSLFSRVSGHYLDSAAFTRAPEAPFGTGPQDQDFGNSGVGMVRGPGQHNMDLAVERAFHVTETESFRLRAEFFNMTNTPQFANPSTSLGYGSPTADPVASVSFGQITATSANPRVIQLAAKYVF